MASNQATAKNLKIDDPKDFCGKKVILQAVLQGCTKEERQKLLKIMLEDDNGDGCDSGCSTSDGSNRFIEPDIKAETISLTGKVVLITGGTSLINFACMK